MDSSVEKFISNFIENQFPQFYQEEGENFIQFVKAYYEWMESPGAAEGDGNGGVIRESRELLTYRDIDDTVETFLEFFQKKYLYGIPFNVIVNKRLLLKHILDVYRSKGAVQCYKLLFRLIYDETVDIYLPGTDVLRISDGKWVEPKYLEISDSEYLNDLIGKTIVGNFSKTTAVVEQIVTEYVNKDKVITAYITSVSPRGGDFIVGERIVDKQFEFDYDNIEKYPLLLGSLEYLDVYNSGNNFNVGDILKVAQKDLDTNEVVSFGEGAIIKIISLFRGYGSLNFNIKNGGFGFLANSDIYLYKNLLDTTGQGASFKIKISDTKNLVYNTDPIVGLIDMTLDSLAFGLPANTSANLASTLEEALNFETGVFGKISTLNNIQTGNGYIAPANTFVRSCITSLNIPGRISYLRANTIINNFSVSFFSNNNSISNNSILFNNADNIFKQDDYVYYKVPTNNTSITGLIANNWYYILSSNDTAVTLSNTIGGSQISISGSASNGETHYLVVNSVISSITANTTGVNNSSEALLITNASYNYDVEDIVYYLVPTGNTAISGMSPNTFYYVKTSNTTAITLSSTLNGLTLNMNASSTSTETHYILNNVQFRNVFGPPSVNGYIDTVFSNTVSINNSSYAIKIPNANSRYFVNDWVWYKVPTNNTAITGLTANSAYYIKTSNTTAITLSQNIGGATVAITGSTSNPAESHFIQTTIFETKKRFSNSDVIYLQANSADANTYETVMIRTVISDTEMVLYDYPKFDYTNNAIYKVTPVIMPAQFANSENYARNTITGNVEVYSILSPYDNTTYTSISSVMRRIDNTTNGINENILALNSSGNNIVKDVTAVNSGRAYVEGEDIRAYRYGILEIPTIVNGGLGYANGDTLIFTGGLTDSPARGSVLVNANGTITSINTSPGAWYAGSGYNTIPEIIVRSSNALAYGASLTTEYIEYDTSNEIRGIVRKKGIGRTQGHWETTDGLLNSDKVIQDSYYYQDYSYEIKASLSLENYKDILYTTFHTAGSELFGKFDLQPFNLVEYIDSIDGPMANTANTNWPNYLTCDITDWRVTCDNNDEPKNPGTNTYFYVIRVSEYLYPNNSLSCDINTFRCSVNTITLDRLDE